MSFAFDKGASRYFVVAVIASSKPNELRQTLAQVRAQAHLPPRFEFKFNRFASARLRKLTLEALAGASFESWAIVVDKSTISSAFKVMRHYEFYLFFVTELLQQIPSDKREGATLILDEFGSAKQLYAELNRFMKAREIPRHFKTVQIRRSQSEPLIQIADIVAGALLRRDSVGDADAFEILRNRIRSVHEFRG